MLETCGDAENQLALELSQHEVFVEKEIVDPLCSIAEVGASCTVAMTAVCAFDKRFLLEIRGVN